MKRYKNSKKPLYKKTVQQSRQKGAIGGCKLNTTRYLTAPEDINQKRIDEYEDDNMSESQLPLIAEEIKARINRTKQDIYKVGELLTIAKSILPHGSFKDWIKDNFDFSYNTANNMMHVYACCAGEPNVVSKIKPSILYKITTKDFPDSLRQFILDNADILEDIDNETIVDIGKRFAQGELDLESNEIQELVKYNQERDKEEYMRFEIKKFIDKLSTVKNSLVSNIEKIKPPFLDDEGSLSKKHKALIKGLLEEMKETIESLRPACN